MTERLRVAALAIVLAAAVGVFACAGSSPTPSSETAETSGRIDDVVVDSRDGGATVTLMGPHEPVFTAFQMSEPDRVIVDLAGVAPGTVGDAPVAVYDGLVQEINVASFATGGDEEITRVEISLTAAADYDVHPVEGGVAIELVGLSSMTSMDDGQAAPVEDPWEVVPASDVEATEAMDEAEADAIPELAGSEPVAPLAQAGMLSRIDAEATGDGTLIRLVGDGSFESVVAFTLENPDRLVIDLPEVKSSVQKKQMDVAGDWVDGIRIGVHPDKVRVVIDGGSAADGFQGRQVVPVPTGLVVALGAGPELDAAVASAVEEAPSAPVARADVPAPAQDEDAWEQPSQADAAPVVADEPATPPGATTIYGVEFDMQDERDRVVVLGEEPFDYLVYEPDQETVVLSIEGAVIDPEAAVRITPEPGGPVSLVTAFDQPDVPRPEVRVVVKRAAGLKPEITRRGSLLMLDFARTGGVASTPPAYLGENGELIPAETADGEPVMAEVVTAGAEPPLEGTPLASQGASAALPPAPLDGGVPADPGAIDPPASISILNEGGLMDGKEYVGRRISLDFKDVAVADVLRLIAEVSDLNVIAGDEVKGNVTIRLVDIPWDQALDVILLTKGLGFVRVGNVLRIAPSDVLAQEEELRLQERRAKEKLEDLVVKLQPVNYADVGDVSGMISQLLTPRGSVNTDTRTNTLIIKDIASVIDEATALVKAVDTMTPQVMIEAKIVEAGLEFSREFGSIWSFGTNPTTQATLGGRDFIFTDGDAGNGNNIAFGNPITAGPTSLVNLAATVLDSRFNIEAQIQAAEVNGDGKVVSSPRIVTLDNSEALIEQGVSIPFQTFENGDAQLEFVDAVLQLKVTPHITSDKSIIMEILVSRNAPDDSVFTLTGSPAIAKNQVKTETLVKDGQTLVLGGIYVVDKSERQSRVPYLHKIPFLGMAFKSDEFSDSRKELLIFVTPRVVLTPAAAS